MPATRVPYRIETERLALRCWSPRDAAALRAAIDRNDAYLRPWIPFMRNEPRSFEQTVEWLRARRAMFDRDENHGYAVERREDGALVGEALLIGRAGPDALEVGYWIDRDCAGRGFATEAAGALVRVAFDSWGVKRVELHCSPENPASSAVARKLGFTHEATLAARFESPLGEIQDSMLWSLFAEAYPSSPANSIAYRAYDALDLPIE